MHDLEAQDESCPCCGRPVLPFNRFKVEEGIKTIEGNAIATTIETMLHYMLDAKDGGIATAEEAWARALLQATKHKLAGFENQAQVARRLGLARQTLNSRLDKAPDFGHPASNFRENKGVFSNSLTRLRTNDDSSAVSD